MLMASLADVQHLGRRLRPESAHVEPGSVTYRELEGPGALRYVVSARDLRTLSDAVLKGARARLGRSVRRVQELGAEQVLVLPPEEQYLVSTGRTYFRDLDWDGVVRMHFDLETTGLDPERDRIFLIALRAPDGAPEVLEAASLDDAGEAALIARLVRRIVVLDPDVIENHNLHGFDLPFLVGRAARLGVTLGLGRFGPPGLRLRPSAQGRRAAPSPEPIPGCSCRNLPEPIPGCLLSP